MRKLLCCICLFLLYSTAFSQTNGNYNYTLGVKAFSQMQLPKILNQTNSQKYTNAYLNGLIVKFNDNQISYRLNGSYYRKDISFYNQCTSCEIANGQVTDYFFTIGFEKRLNYGRIQPYFGGDIGFRSNHFMGDIRTANPKSINLPYDIDTDKNGFLMTPLLGIKISPIDRISIFAETSLDFYYFYERQETIQQDAANTRTFAKYTKWEFLLNPISVGVQFHFGAKD